jgi:serine/threonine-protein kinase HipA
MITLFYETLPVAHLNETEPLHLTYDQTWLDRNGAFPLSLTMPLTRDPYPAGKILPWLANLLPETHLSEIGQRLKISPQDSVALLQHIGRDTAGALSIGVPGEQGTHIQWLDHESELERIINELPERPFLTGERGVSMSLAGVQDKLPVYSDESGRMGIPLDGTPSTHILKPDVKRLYGSVQNEAFCMVLAKLCGLKVANVQTATAGKRNYLLVERYDRVRDDEGVVHRTHQEDFCQVLQLFPARKYEKARIGGQSGPGLRDFFQAVKIHLNPAERLTLLDGVLFNVFICNSDSHAKNYSIQILAGGHATIAPLYDLICAKVYDHVDQHLAQSIAGKVVAEELHKADWLKLATDVELSGSTLLKRVGELGQSVLDHIDEAAAIVGAMPAGRSDVLERVAHDVSSRTMRILRQLQ